MNRLINLLVLDQLRPLDLDVGEIDVTFVKNPKGDVIEEIYEDVSGSAPVILKRVEYGYDAQGSVLTETVTKGSLKYRKTFECNELGEVQKIQVRQVVD